MDSMDKFLLIAGAPLWIPLFLIFGFLTGPIWMYFWMKENL